ncbi:MAG TPA: hydroxymethylbilane synthase [Solirubrobacteraceae bacterium]|jgi:hydroxymethylbilane synthase|nr:hydroxymethylbilane synthase [Solirubrobacteraceae bacterium]
MRIGTRRSALALAQAELVAGMLGGAEIVPIVTGGDAGAGPEDKSRWVDGLERALRDSEIDLAVHSAKDLPGHLAAGLALLAAPSRAGAEDVLCGAAALGELVPGARVGTSSLRRIAQLRSARPDLEVVPLHGNVDTRLAKLAAGDGLDAIVLARAGLQRLGREAEAGGLLDPGAFVPAPGQGALALEGRADDDDAREQAQRIGDEATLAALRAERALARELGADCHTPLGAHARTAGDGTLTLRAWVGLPDGSAWASDELAGEQSDPERLGREVAGRLLVVGADELLERARRTSGGGPALAVAPESPDDAR